MRRLHGAHIITFFCLCSRKPFGHCIAKYAAWRAGQGTGQGGIPCDPMWKSKAASVLCRILIVAYVRVALPRQTYLDLGRLQGGTRQPTIPPALLAADSPQLPSEYISRSPLLPTVLKKPDPPPLQGSEGWVGGSFVRVLFALSRAQKVIAGPPPPVERCKKICGAYTNKLQRLG